MRLPLPSVTIRAKIVNLLDNFYDQCQIADFDRAIQILAEWYHLEIPVVQWYEYIDRGRTGGQVLESGIIQLQHPENWKRSKGKTQGKRQWTRMVLHEWGHYFLWADAERKAEKFERAFIRGARPRTGGTI